jgi:hypothetical protein
VVTQLADACSDAGSTVVDTSVKVALTTDDTCDSTDISPVAASRMARVLTTSPGSEITTLLMSWLALAPPVAAVKPTFSVAGGMTGAIPSVIGMSPKICVHVDDDVGLTQSETRLSINRTLAW